MASIEERVRQPSAGSASLVRGPFTTGRVNNNLVFGDRVRYIVFSLLQKFLLGYG